MQITPRAAALAVALFASAPLLAAGVGTAETTKQDSCTLLTLPSTDLSAGLADLLPKPGSMPDTAEMDRGLSKPVACMRPSGLGWNDEPEDSTSPERSFSVTAMPSGTSTTWPWQRSSLQGSRDADGLSISPAKPGMHFSR
jgi:hypothetical protein